MKILTLIILALGLSMDCFAVAIGTAFSHKKLKIKKFLIISLMFGVAHFVMPLIGWLIGSTFKIYIEAYDHWIAFGLLIFIGIKMLLESIKKNDAKNFCVEKFSVVFLLTLATSIDALIIGMSLAFLNFHLLISAAVISFSAFIISFLGFNLGRKFGYILGNKAEIIGGIILIVIGVKILFEHLFNGINIF